MPRIISFDTSHVRDRTILGVRVRCTDATEALHVLNRVKEMLASAGFGVEDAVIDDYAVEERKAIQEDGAAEITPVASREAAAREEELRKLRDQARRDEIEERRREEEEARLNAEAKAGLPRPGLDPAEALKAYTQQGADPEPPARFAGYVKGERYDGVEIMRCQDTGKGYGVLLLVDGTKIKYDTATGHEVARKGGPRVPDANDLEVVPSSRQSGVRAPETDEPAADTRGTPLGEVPDWMVPIVEAESLADAVGAALDVIDEKDLVAWAMEHRDCVPAFGRVAEARLAARVERQILART